MMGKGHGVLIGGPYRSWLTHCAQAEQIPYFNFSLEYGPQDNLYPLLVKILREQKIDLIYYSIPGIQVLTQLLDRAVRKVGRGCILLRLGVSPEPEEFSPEQLGYGLNTVRGVITVSEESRRRLLTFVPCLTQAYAQVIYNGVDLEKFNPCKFAPQDRRKLKATLGIPDDHVVVAAAGRLDPIKNLSALVLAAKRVVSRCPKTSFLIAGEGKCRRSLVEMTREMGIADHFCFTGFVDVEEMPYLVQGIDLFVHTSISEGLPNVVLESMAMGKPVVATAIGGIPEVIKDGKSGILIPPVNVKRLAVEIQNMLSDPVKMKLFGDEARKSMERNFDRRLKLQKSEALFATAVGLRA